jgi:hypothetical protein
MFRLIWALVRLGFKVMFATGIALLVAGWFRLRQEHRTWGVAEADAARPLAGDGLVKVPDIVDTRSLSLAAPPSAIWPWLVQMGYERGGWYSYDQIDMKGRSARTILPEHQGLAVGDVVPTYPDGGFVVRVLEPERALVLYLDSELVRSQVEAARSARGEAPGGGGSERPIPGLAVAGAVGEITMPEFRVSWAFVLEPESADRTRLVERFRVWTPGGGLPQRLGMPFMGYGVFAMTRKQMLGIKERAEALVHEGWTPPTPPGG